MSGKSITIHEIVERLVFAEGKKVQISRGNAKEVISIISDMVYQDVAKDAPHNEQIACIEGVVAALYRNGRRRAKKK